METLKAYTIAMKSKDITMMKLLLSEGSLKLHQDEASARGVTLDEIVQQQTLFAPDQRVFDYRNQKIEGDSATVEVKNAFGGWDTVFLVREGGTWKIDRKGTSDKMIEDIEKQNELLDQQIEEGQVPVEESPLPEGDLTPADTTPSPVPNPNEPVPSVDPTTTPPPASFN